MHKPEPLYLALQASNQPFPFFAALDQRLQDEVGHILLTLLAVGTGDVWRIYSSDPAHYPVQGRKPMLDTPWGRHVIDGKQSFLARNRKDLEWAFFDHALIASLGGYTQINVPVVFDGACIGTINLTGGEDAYDEMHLAGVESFAPWLIPAFLMARHQP